MAKCSVYCCVLVKMDPEDVSLTIIDLYILIKVKAEVKIKAEAAIF